MKDKSIIAGIVCLIVGVVLIVVGIIFLRNGANFSANGLLTKGTVIEIVSQSSYNSQTQSTSVGYQARVLFANANGQTFSFLSQFITNPPSYKVEQKVDVIYDPANPQGAVLADEARNPIPYIPFFVVGALLIGVGGVITIASRLR